MISWHLRMIWIDFREAWAFSHLDRFPHRCWQSHPVKSTFLFQTVRAMGGVGDVLAPKMIAEIGDNIRRFHSGKSSYLKRGSCFFALILSLKLFTFRRR